jgi:hypothetical protein
LIRAFGGRDALACPTAEEALKRLEPLLGEWRLTATSSGGRRSRVRTDDLRVARLIHEYSRAAA